MTQGSNTRRVIRTDYRQTTRGWESEIRCNVLTPERVYTLTVALARHGGERERVEGGSVGKVQKKTQAVGNPQGGDRAGTVAGDSGDREWIDRATKSNKKRSRWRTQHECSYCQGGERERGERGGMGSGRPAGEGHKCSAVWKLIKQTAAFAKHAAGQA